MGLKLTIANCSFFYKSLHYFSFLIDVLSQTDGSQKCPNLFVRSGQKIFPIKSQRSLSGEYFNTRELEEREETHVPDGQKWARGFSS